MGCRELQFRDYLEFTLSGETLTSLHGVPNLDFSKQKINDANKNVSELIDSNGTIQAHYEYSPFGKVTVFNGSYAIDNPYRFSSEVADDETGLVYYNYRYYSPELGRWLSSDPIREKGGVNLYAMVGNAPTTSWDWRGLGYFELTELDGETEVAPAYEKNSGTLITSNNVWSRDGFEVRYVPSKGECSSPCEVVLVQYIHKTYYEWGAGRSKPREMNADKQQYYVPKSNAYSKPNSVHMQIHKAKGLAR